MVKILVFVVVLLMIAFWVMALTAYSRRKRRKAIAKRKVEAITARAVARVGDPTEKVIDRDRRVPDQPNAILREKLKALADAGIPVRLLPYQGKDPQQRGKFVLKLPDDMTVDPYNTWEAIAFASGMYAGIYHERRAAYP